MNRFANESEVEALNEEYGFEDRVRFESGRGGFLFCRIESGNSTAVVSHYGGQVIELELAGTSVLWLSPESLFEAGKAIRGGIPVCWPWFGPHPDDATKPNHGFARTQNWQIVESSVGKGEGTSLKLQLNDDESTHQWFDAAFRLQLTLTLSDTLTLELESTNLSSQSIPVGGALHSYFNVGDINNVTVSGLDQTKYIDQLDGNKFKTQSGPLQFEQEVDFVYLDENPAVDIEQPGLTYRVEKRGSCSTVVWNPWTEKAKRITDMPDDAYKSFVCVETANAFEDTRTLAPQQSHVLTQRIGLMR